MAGAAVTGFVLSGDVAFEYLDVLSGNGHAVMVIGHQTGRLKGMDKLVDALIAPVEVHFQRLALLWFLNLGPVAVEPDAADGAVVGEKFGNLLTHEVQVMGIIGLGIAVAAGIVVAAPVQQGIIEIQADSLCVAGVGQLLDGIPVPGRGVHHIVGRGLGGEHGEAVMVTGGDGDILGAGSLDLAHPLPGVESGRIETARIRGIRFIRDLLIVHHPFALGQHGIHAPVDENAEFLVAELFLGSHRFRSGNIPLDAFLYIGKEGGLGKAQKGRQQ